MKPLRIPENAPYWVPRAFRAMEARGIPKQALGKVFDRAQQTVYSYLSGQAEPSYQQLIDLASFLRISLDELLGDEEFKMPAATIPIRNQVDAFSEVEVDEELLTRDPTPEELEELVAQVNGPSDPEDAARFVPPVAVGEFAFGVRVQSREAEPEFRRGDVLVVDPQRRDFRDGDFVLIKTAGRGVPEIRQVAQGKRLVLYPVGRGTPTPAIDGLEDVTYMEKILARVQIYEPIESMDDV